MTIAVSYMWDVTVYIDKKERQRSAFNYLELNQINYLDVAIGHLIY